MAELVQQQILPAPFIEAAAKPYLQELTTAVGGLKAADLSKSLGSQFIAAFSRLGNPMLTGCYLFYVLVSDRIADTHRGTIQCLQPTAPLLSCAQKSWGIV